MSTVDVKTRLSEKVQKSQISKRTERTNTANPETTLAAVKPGYMTLPANAIKIINENLKNKPLSRQSIDIVKAPAGGTIAFTVPGLTGDEVHKDLTGVILDYATPRAYWETSDPTEGTPPSCYSPDSVTSYDGKPCSQCMYNAFGSKDGDSNAKACKESVELYLLRPGNIMPIIVRIPVSSKCIFQKYLTRLVSNMIPLSGVVTKITLEKATSRQGQAYAQYCFEATNVLSVEESGTLMDFSQKIMEVVTSRSALPGEHGVHELAEAV